MMSSPPSDSPSDAPRLYSPLPICYPRDTALQGTSTIISRRALSFCTLLYCTVLWNSTVQLHSIITPLYRIASQRIASYASSLIASLLFGSLHLIESLSAVIHLQTRPDAPPAFCLLLLQLHSLSCTVVMHSQSPTAVQTVHYCTEQYKTDRKEKNVMCSRYSYGRRLQCSLSLSLSTHTHTHMSHTSATLFSTPPHQSTQDLHTAAAESSTSAQQLYCTSHPVIRPVIDTRCRMRRQLEPLFGSGLTREGFAFAFAEPH